LHFHYPPSAAEAITSTGIVEITPKETKKVIRAKRQEALNKLIRFAKMQETGLHQLGMVIYNAKHIP
jgi:hypothetical protein